MAKAVVKADLTQIDVVVSKQSARIRCTAAGQSFDQSGPLAEVLAKWTAFMDQLPAGDRSSASFAMDLAKAALR